VSAEQQASLLSVMTEGFALEEARLFLDTHPANAEALQFLAQCRVAYQAAYAAYTAQFAPLQIDDASPVGPDAWVCLPWPWEMEG
jgi:spore coat protein JB